MIPTEPEEGASPQKVENEVGAVNAARDSFSDDSQCLLDELVAAEAQLKAAQERYDAIKARMEASSVSSVGDGASLEATAYTSPAYAQASHTVSSAAPPSSSVQASRGVPKGEASAAPPTSSPQQPYYSYSCQQSGPYVYTRPSYNASMAASKDHVAAGLLAIFLGFLGIHKFYLGYNTSGFIMLAISILGSLLTLCLAGAVIWVIAIVEGILYLTKSQTEFEQTYVFNKREWF